MREARRHLANQIKTHNSVKQIYVGPIFIVCCSVLDVDVDVDVVDLRAQADASMPASNNNVNFIIYSNF